MHQRVIDDSFSQDNRSIIFHSRILLLKHINPSWNHTTTIDYIVTMLQCAINVFGRSIWKKHLGDVYIVKIFVYHCFVFSRAWTTFSALLIFNREKDNLILTLLSKLIDSRNTINPSLGDKILIWSYFVSIAFRLKEYILSQWEKNVCLVWTFSPYIIKEEYVKNVVLR